jgi:sugar lactone lactonase YvrE
MTGRRFTSRIVTPGEWTCSAPIPRPARGLWLAVWGSGELRRYTPDGQVDVVVSLPVTQVTSAAFGGPGLDTLYITTARENFTPADLAAQPHAGDIFACTPGVTGRPPFRFGGPASG